MLYTALKKSWVTPCFSSVTVIVRNNEIDVATGDMRMVIIVHENNGPKILWPVLRQRPSDNNAEGLLGEWKAVCVCVLAALVFNVASLSLSSCRGCSLWGGTASSCQKTKDQKSGGRRYWVYFLFFFVFMFLFCFRIQPFLQRLMISLFFLL